MNAPQIQMPQYQAHKKVWALQIAAVVDSELSFVRSEYAPKKMTEAYMIKHRPQAGGYYVVYPDGYESWSPQKAFEEGYSEI